MWFGYYIILIVEFAGLSVMVPKTNRCELSESDLDILRSPSYLSDEIIWFYFSYLTNEYFVLLISMFDQSSWFHLVLLTSWIHHNEAFNLVIVYSSVLVNIGLSFSVMIPSFRCWRYNVNLSLVVNYHYSLVLAS